MDKKSLLKAAITVASTFGIANYINAQSLDKHPDKQATNSIEITRVDTGYSFEDAYILSQYRLLSIPDSTVLSESIILNQIPIESGFNTWNGKSKSSRYNSAYQITTARDCDNNMQCLKYILGLGTYAVTAQNSIRNDFQQQFQFFTRKKTTTLTSNIKPQP